MIVFAILGLVILLSLTIFQILLILGKPFGEFAWGGQHKVLPKKLRVASATSIVLYAVFAIFLASKSGLVDIITLQPLLTIVMWVFTSYFFLGIVMNFASRNKKEQAVMTPVATALAVVFLIVTLS